MPRARTRVLIVDDDAAVRRRHRVILEGAGFHVVEGESAAHALELVRGGNADILLLDLVMPAPTGWEVLGTFALESVLSPLPVVALTWSADEENELLAKELGAAAYVVKPIASEDLVSLVHRLAGAAPR